MAWFLLGLFGIESKPTRRLFRPTYIATVHPLLCGQKKKDKIKNKIRVFSTHHNNDNNETNKRERERKEKSTMKRRNTTKNKRKDETRKKAQESSKRPVVVDCRRIRMNATRSNVDKEPTIPRGSSWETSHDWTIRLFFCKTRFICLFVCFVASFVVMRWRPIRNE